MSLSPRAYSCMHGLPNARGDEPFASARRAVLVIGSATFGGPHTATVSSTAPRPCASCVPAPAAPVPQPRIARRPLAEPFACQACLETQMDLAPLPPESRTRSHKPDAPRDIILLPRTEDCMPLSLSPVLALHSFRADVSSLEQL